MRFKVDIDADICKGCALCVDVCPRRIIAMSDRLNSAGAHFASITSRDGCVGCLQCSIICPDAAIEIGQHDELSRDEIA